MVAMKGFSVVVRHGHGQAGWRWCEGLDSYASSLVSVLRAALQVARQAGEPGLYGLTVILMPVSI